MTHLIFICLKHSQQGYHGQFPDKVPVYLVSVFYTTPKKMSHYWEKEEEIIVPHVCQSLGLASLQPYGLQPATLLSPWDSPGKNTGVGCHVLLQGIFPGTEPWSPALQADSLWSEPPGKPGYQKILFLQKLQSETEDVCDQLVKLFKMQFSVLFSLILILELFYSSRVAASTSLQEGGLGRPSGTRFLVA